MTFSGFTNLTKSLPSTVPFVGPETYERAHNMQFNARLGANENGFGFAPSVQRAIEEKAHLSWRYGDPESFDLKSALADHYRIKFENIVIGEGIDGLLGLLVRLVVNPGTPVVTSLGAYPTFNFHVVGFGGQLETVPFRNDYEDLDALLGKVVETKAPLVYLSNPDNPMGTFWQSEKISDFVEALPETTMLVLDEAYCELAPPSAIPTIDAFLDKSNVLRMRTFSKVYGLAGMRVGYAIGEPGTILMFERVRNHFGMSGLSQIAALAAVKDQAYLKSTIGKVDEARSRISNFVAGLGFTPIVSGTNFVSFDCGRDGDFARKIMAQLTEKGVFVRMPAVAPLDRCLRVSVGPAEELAAFEAGLSDIIGSM